jgi:hypothetical protein
MVNEIPRQVGSKSDCDSAVAEFIRTRGVTRCPTACVLPTQGAIGAVDREALEEYALRREQLRRVRLATRMQQFWVVEPVQPVEK